MLHDIIFIWIRVHMVLCFTWACLWLGKCSVVHNRVVRAALKVGLFPATLGSLLALFGKFVGTINCYWSDKDQPNRSTNQCSKSRTCYSAHGHLQVSSLFHLFLVWMNGVTTTWIGRFRNPCWKVCWSAIPRSATVLLQLFPCLLLRGHDVGRAVAWLWWEVFVMLLCSRRQYYVRIRHILMILIIPSRRGRRRWRIALVQR